MHVLNDIHALHINKGHKLVQEQYLIFLNHGKCKYNSCDHDFDIDYYPEIYTKQSKQTYLDLVSFC
jgi:hypothetical protein